MSSEALRRIESIYQAALERPEGERAAYLDEACGDDTGLRREIESLLYAHPRALEWFDELGRRVETDAPLELAGSWVDRRRIGPWRTVRRLGRGGMGIVYLAERDDGRFAQRAAVKVIDRGWASDDVVPRFLAERRLLARLEHRHVARLLDGGETEDGLPWFAMEYVEGVQLDRWCRDRSVPLESRLRLLLQIGDAVQYLHRNLVVHRDLKPANVLVTGDGEAKVVDFGIAKSLDPGPDATSLTRTGQRPRTPLYAAPEQILGDPITTATDVYALGAILYHLLAGRPPFEGRGHDLERAILEGDPPPPSRAAGADARRIRGDLDTICLVALRKDPDRRYPSVERMTGDVRAHLEGRPISARADSLPYRARKFVRRHVIGVAAAVGLVLLTGGFGTFTALQSARIARERDRAERVSGLLVDVLSAADPTISAGEDVTARELADRGVERIRAETGDPLLRADLFSVLGLTYKNLGLYDRAVSLLEEVHGTREAMLASDHPDLAASHYNLGEALIATADYDRARHHLEAALRIRESRLGPAHPDVATVVNDLARLESALGERDAAIALHERALSIRRAAGDSVGLSQSFHNLGGILSSIGRDGEAIPMLEEAVRIRRAEFGSSDPRTLLSMNSLAVARERTGRLDEAENLYRAVLAGNRRLYGSESPRVALPMGNLANLLVRTPGNEREAEALHREALAIERAALGDAHPQVGQRYHTLARALHAQGRLEEAESTFRLALSILLGALPEGHVNLAFPMTELGRVLVDQGRAGEAAPILREALALRRAGFPAGHVRIAEAEVALGAALAAGGAREEAEGLVEAALEVLRMDPGSANQAAEAADVLERLRGS